MKLVIGNQKSYLDEEQIDDFIKGISNVKTNNVIICPSSIYFNKFNECEVLLGSQNVSNYDSGATTGEISSEQLKSIGVHFSLVGHSERREKQKETIEDTNIKIRQLLSSKMAPILCVGETKEERDNKKTVEVVLNQLKGAFKDLLSSSVDKIIIAYEPIWAIGSGVTPTNDEIEKVLKEIRHYVNNQYRTNNLILYGGSINSNNIDELLKIGDADGFLIGGSSTKLNEFLTIIDKCS